MKLNSDSKIHFIIDTSMCTFGETTTILLVKSNSINYGILIKQREGNMSIKPWLILRVGRNTNFSQSHEALF